MSCNSTYFYVQVVHCFRKPISIVFDIILYCTKQAEVMVYIHLSNAIALGMLAFTQEALLMGYLLVNIKSQCKCLHKIFLDGVRHHILYRLDLDYYPFLESTGVCGRRTCA